mmetsp:Transcript_39734/g.67728  ORF Transcript_39734/g.67728 Transcript_39734/m.67728 type:complete len:223 (-) Transcript_39734:595-1263(-)
MSQTGMKRYGRTNLRQLSNPTLCHPIWDQINFVQYKHQMLVRGILRNVPFDHGASRTGHIPRINNVKNDIRTVHHLVKFAPNTFGLSLEEQIVLFGMNPVNSLPFGFGEVGIFAPGDDARAVVYLGVGILRFLRGGKEGSVARGIVGGDLSDGFGRATLVWLVFFIIVIFIIHDLGRTSHHVLFHLDAFSPTLAPKSVFERFVRQQSLVVITGCIQLGRILQ